MLKCFSHGRSRFAIVAFVLATSLALIGANPLRSQTKIMPLGDSITDGDGSSNAGGYRSYLYNLFTNSGMGIDMVGSLNGGTGWPDTQHEGHGGFRADQIRDNIINYLTANPAKVIFLEVGTNDITEGADANTVLGRISAIIDNIYSVDSQIEIYLSTTLPRKDSAALETVTDNLNALLPNMVAQKRVAGVNIHLVDVASVFKSTPNYTTTLYFDNIHPNDTGYNIVAQQLFTAYENQHSATLFTDNFDTGTMKAEWVAHAKYQVVNKQLVNTDNPNASYDGFNNFLAIPNVDVNPNSLQFTYGTASDQTGRDFTGAAVLMSGASTTASGYLIFHTTAGTQRVRLFEVANGVVIGNAIADVAAAAGPTNVGDTFRVEWSTTTTAHTFRVFINGVLDATVSDNSKRQGNNVLSYAGIMINNNTNNGVDDFQIERSLDSTAPAAIADLGAASPSANTITLSWTAPGDDGSTGTATLYDIRYSTSLITSINFSSATQVTGEPIPSVAGSPESMIVTGLTAGTAYYFAMTAVDEANNISGLSNVVSASTLTLNSVTDNFNRANGSLGSAWAADPEMQIVSNAVQATSNFDRFDFAAVYKDRKNPVEASWKWGPNATSTGISFSGIFFGDSPSTTANGYMIQRRVNNGKTVLWYYTNGQPSLTLDEGTHLAADPVAGSTMKVVARREGTGNAFDVYIDGVFDRTLFDADKRISDGTPYYAGIMLNDALSNENAIDEFTISSPLGTPSLLTKISGDAQVDTIGQTLPNPLVVRLTDTNSSPVEGASIDFVVTQGSATFDKQSGNDGNSRKEAEQSIITGPIEIRNDADASGGKYIVYPSPGADATAKLSFSVSSAATYYFWTRSIAKDNPTGNYAWDVSIDDGASFRYNVFQGNVPKTSWTWNRITERVGSSDQTKTVQLSAGLHTISFIAAHYQTWLDKVLVTSNPNYIPSGLEPEVGYTTDANGQTQAIVTLGTQVGPVVVQASYPGITPVNFNLTARGGAATTLVKISGDNQSGVAGQALAQPFVVEVRDDGGNPIQGYKVNWVVSQGGGYLNVAQPMTTDANGRASVILTVGNQDATNKVMAYSAGLSGSPATFTATATGKVGSKIQLVSGNNQTGTVHSTLASQLVARVLDATDQAVVDFPVSFVAKRGGGSASKATLLKNAGLEGTYSSHPQGLGMIAPNWGSWNTDNSQTHSKVAGFSSAAAQEMNTTGSATAASISQTIANSPANGTRLQLSFFYKTTTSTDPAINIRMRKTLDSVLVALNLPPTGGQWRQVVHYFTWNSAYQPLQIHLVVLDNVIVDLDDINIFYVTDAQGQIATNWTLGDTAMVQELQAVALAGGTNLSSSPLSFQATANAGTASKLVEVSGNNQAGSAGQPLSNPFKAQVTDAYGNAKSGHQVTFTVTAGGGTLDGGVTTLNATTDANGYASATLTLGSSVGVTNKAQAAASQGGSPLTNSPITFSAIAATPTKLAKLTGDGQTGSAYLPLAAPLKVLVTDAQDRPISGHDVTFTVTQGNGTINGQSTAVIKTGGNGEAAATFVLGPTPGATNNVTASASFQGSPLTGSPISFTATASNLSQLVLLDGNNQTGAVGSALGQPFKAKIIDVLGNGIKGQQVTFNVTSGGGKIDGTATTKAVTTDSLGVAKVTLTLGTTPGTDNNVVTASASANGQPLTGSPLTFKASATAAQPVAINIEAGNNQRGVVGSPLPTPLKVKVVDTFGNGVANHSVTFVVKAGGGNIGGKTTETVSSDNNGIAQVTLTLGANAGDNNNRVEASASSGGNPLTNSPLTFTASATASAARNIVLVSGNGQSGSAGDTLAQMLVVKITDNTGTNPVQGHPVTFRVTAGGGKLFADNGNSGTEIVVSTNSNGIAASSFVIGGATGANAQKVDAIATDGSQPLIGSPVQFTATAIAGNTSATKSVIEATGPVSADGAAKSNVTITLKDDFGNPVIGHAVTISVSGEGNVITQPQDVSNSQGKVTGSFSSTRSGSKVVTARDVNARVDITNGATVVFTPLPASKLVMDSGNNQTGNTGTALLLPLVAKVTDTNGNPIANHPVTFQPESGGGYIYEPQPIDTDANGLAKATYVLGTSAGLNVIKATANNLAATPVTFNATAKISAASKTSLYSGNAQNGVAGEILPLPIAVFVSDNADNPIFGHNVQFRVTFGSGTVEGGTEVTKTTDAFGIAKVNWRLGTAVGPNILEAVADGLSSFKVIFTAQGSSGQPVKLVMTGTESQDAIVGQTAPNALVVKVTDANGNSVSGVIVNYELVKGTGTLSASQRTTNTDGLASVNLTLGTDTGERVVRVHSEGLLNSPLNFFVNGTASAPKSIAILDGDNQSGTVGKPLSRSVRVIVKDQNGNPVPGVSVNFAPTLNNGQFVESQPVNTDERGIAKATWILGTASGSNKAWAILQGLPQVEFSATGVQNNFPVFQSIADRVINEKEYVEFQVIAADDDGDPMTFGAKKLPDGATFDSLGTRLFSWTPGYDAAGYREAIFVARDNKGGVSELLVTFEVRNVNRSPQLSNWQPGVEKVTILDEKPVTFQASATDPDGDQVSYLWFIDGKHVGSANIFVYRQNEKNNYVFEVKAFDAEDTVKHQWTVETTPVKLVTFSATARVGEGVQLRWIAANEINSAGYNILRSEQQNGDYQALNAALIPATGAYDYRFVDRSAKSGTRYYYTLEEISLTGQVEKYGPVMVEMATPETYALYQNYPNPFNPTTNIQYQLPKSAEVSLKIFNSLGQEVRSLVDGKMPAGFHTVLWDGRDNRGLPVPSGVYYYAVRAGSFSSAKKMLLLK